MLNQGRYLLFLDILGFKELVRHQSSENIYKIIDDTIRIFDQWEQRNKFFKTIYFSDTFIFYQDNPGYWKGAFYDIYAISEMILSSLLAASIPARGTISFGEFTTDTDTSGRHQVYYGNALIEAYEAEQREKWIGITILPSAWKPFYSENPELIELFAKEKVWAIREDEVLLLNPFWYFRDTVLFDSGPSRPYSQCGWRGLENDILGFKFLRDQAEKYSKINDFTSSTAIKYHTTVRFLKQILGDELYAWGENAVLPGNF